MTIQNEDHAGSVTEGPALFLMYDNYFGKRTYVQYPIIHDIIMHADGRVYAFML